MCSFDTPDRIFALYFPTCPHRKSPVWSFNNPDRTLSAEANVPPVVTKGIVVGIVAFNVLTALIPLSATFSESNQRDVSKRPQFPTQNPMINPIENPQEFLGIDKVSSCFRMLPHQHQHLGLAPISLVNLKHVCRCNTNLIDSLHEAVAHTSFACSNLQRIVNWVSNLSLPSFALVIMQIRCSF